MAADAGATMTDAAWRDDSGWAYRLTATDGTELFRARLEAGTSRP
jgi:hypothetical protein